MKPRTLPLKKTNLKNQNRKEVNRMQNKFEAPTLTVIGQANEVVMGSNLGGDDVPCQLAADFEFEHDGL
jgi:hypothetical protein